MKLAHETDHSQEFRPLESFDTVHDLKEKLSNLALHDGITRLSEKLQSSENGLNDFKSKIYDTMEVQAAELKALKLKLEETTAELGQTKAILAEYKDAFEFVFSELVLLRDVANGVSFGLRLVS